MSLGVGVVGAHPQRLYLFRNGGARLYAPSYLAHMYIGEEKKKMQIVVRSVWSKAWTTVGDEGQSQNSAKPCLYDFSFHGPKK